jgi:Fe-S-cluster containining protein
MKKTKRVSKLLGSDCGQCSSCCRDIQVDVTDADIRRLIRHTGIPADQLVKLYSHADTEDKEESDWIRLSYGKRAMELNKKRTGDCIFLSEDNACTAYEARPMTCRIFPICVVSDEKNIIVDMEISDVITDKTIRCRRTRGNSRSYTSFMTTARQALSEQEGFQKKLEEWNSSPATGRKKDFLRFLCLKTSTGRSR